MSERTNTAEVVVDDRHTLPVLYDAVLNADSDIKHQLPILHDLAKQCRTVTEFGIRRAPSTIALMAAYPERVISWDIEPAWVQRALLLNCLTRTEPPPGRWYPKLEARCGDTTKISSIEPTDLLWIDTLHNFEQLRSELKRHGNQSRRFIAFHDTSPDGFGYRDEVPGPDGTFGPGLRAAIRWFQDQHFPRWQLVLDDKKGSGMIVLQRHDTPFYPFFGAEFLEGPREAVVE